MSAILSTLTRAVVGKPFPETADGEVALWLSRLQREDNPWLKAERMEQQGRLGDARRMYLLDADRQQEQGRHALAAVARAACAEIAVGLGDADLARRERQRAADHFRTHAEQATEWSIREAAWAYERAAALYGVVGAHGEALKMHRRAADLKGHLAPPVDGIDVPPAPPRHIHAQR